jgi:hypothetical protein
MHVLKGWATTDFAPCLFYGLLCIPPVINLWQFEAQYFATGLHQMKF